MADRPEHNPSKLVHRPAVWTLGLTAFALVLALTACGGDDDDESLPSVADIAPELADFGDFATLHSQPVSETFGPDGGTLDLADGATVEVPKGAFPEPLELTVAIVDVEVEYPVQESRIYQLSTVEDIGPLEPPLVLEVQRPADDVIVAELVDGEWKAVKVPPGPTIRVEITHFTDVYFLIFICSELTGVRSVRDLDDGRLYAHDICKRLLIQPLTPTPSGLSQADIGFITSLVNDVANELERANVSNENIAAAKAAVRSCLTNRLLAGDSHEQALDACDTVDDSYFPSATSTPGPGVTSSPAETSTQSPAPGQTSAPTSTPAPTPTPAPSPKPDPTTIKIVAHTIERRDDHACKTTSELCTYSVTVSVQYTTSMPAAIYCFQVVDGGSAGWGNDTNVPSGAGALTVTNDLHSSPPDGPFPIPITCDLRDITDGLLFAPIIATDSVPLNVSVPPLPE